MSEVPVLVLTNGLKDVREYGTGLIITNVPPEESRGRQQDFSLE